MELEEAIDILKNLNDGYTFKACDVCSNYNETTLRCDKEKCEELIAIDTVIAELFAMQNLLDEKNEELDRLQKENEKYENKIILSDEEYRRVIDEAQKDCISKDKIKCLMLDKRKKIVENNIEIEECRKTIMEEQELKKLQLFTLHKNNDLLELEIADLFDLLKEE